MIFEKPYVSKMFLKRFYSFIEVCALEKTSIAYFNNFAA